ncbi:DUF3152 domain-containing protein [Streptomyces fumanus]|nr:DUF3152 domain-containing protein [Streptomyces fumanus]
MEQTPGTPGRTPPQRGAAPGGRGGARLPDGAPARGARLPDGTPAQGVPRVPDGTPARGVPRLPDGTPAQGVPRLPDGTPAHGVPRLPDGTPAHGVPRAFEGGPGTPAHGVPQVRGGHPEQREAGGGWGELRGRAGAAGAGQAPGVPLPRQRQRQAPVPGGPRQDYLDAFGADGDGFAPRKSPSAAADPYATVTDWNAAEDAVRTRGTARAAVDAPPAPSRAGAPAEADKGGKGRTYTGIAAAAVTTVLAIVVAGQVTDGRAEDAASRAATDQARDLHVPAPDVSRPAKTGPGATGAKAPLTYAQKMSRTYPLSPTLKGSGKFDAVPGVAKAPGKGQKFTYRVDVERGLRLDGGLFARAVQETLNDDRSWAHNGARTFERIHSGHPDFVITLASPGTTADWCAKSGLDTTIDNVSCDSAATERVMINAYRWARGAKTYGDAKIYAYRQMLINHEVGHRLGHNHVTCDKDGDLAPVMQQQTKFLEYDGIRCRANPWPYPND